MKASKQPLLTPRETGPKSYLGAFAALLVLLVVTVGIAYLPLGRWNLAAALGIATVKAAIVLWAFMHLGTSPRLVGAFGIAIAAILTIAGILTTADYLTR